MKSDFASTQTCTSLALLGRGGAFFTKFNRLSCTMLQSLKNVEGWDLCYKTTDGKIGRDLKQNSRYKFKILVPLYAQNQYFMTNFEALKKIGRGAFLTQN